MAIYHLQAVLHHDSNLAADLCVNNWHIDANSDQDAITALSSFHVFYAAIASYLSSNLNGNIEYKLYREADAKPRVPFHIAPQTLTIGVTAAPAQVALCLSFEADKVSGIPQARRRGRVYIGPLAHTAMSGATGKPDTVFQNALKTAGENLLTASSSSGSWNWVAWSATYFAAAVITDVWVDNRWDTQRRRLEQPTAKLTTTNRFRVQALPSS